MIRHFHDKHDQFFFHQSNNFIPLVLNSVNFNVFTLIQQEELMGWHASGVKRNRILKYAISLNQLQKHVFKSRGVRGGSGPWNKSFGDS